MHLEVQKIKKLEELFSRFQLKWAKAHNNKRNSGSKEWEREIETMPFPRIFKLIPDTRINLFKIKDRQSTKMMIMI